MSIISASLLRSSSNRSQGIAARVALLLLGGVAFLAVGRVALDNPLLAVGAVAALTVGVLAVTDPLALAVLTPLSVWLTVRVGRGLIDMSGSDAILVLSSLTALAFVPWSARPLRRVLGVILAFEAVLFVTVLAHFRLDALFEWGHRLFLTAGSVVVGAAIVSERRTESALKPFLAVTACIGGLVTLDAAAAGFSQQAEFVGLHKNFVGSMMVAGLAIRHLAHRSVSLSGGQRVLVDLLCGAGLIASQSRGAVAGLIVGLLLAVVRSPALRRRALPLVVLLLPVAVSALLSVRTQIDQAETVATSSITERARFREQALEAWRASPVLGQGLRFFETGELALTSDPHNVILASLSETGVAGLGALLVLVAGTVIVLWRVPSDLAAVAIVVFSARFVHGLFDIYWVAGTQALPWLLVGMALVHRPGDRDKGPGEWSEPLSTGGSTS